MKNSKRIASIIVLLIISISAQSQLVMWDWVKQAGGTSDDYPYMLIVDNVANVIVTGSYNGVATFGDTIINSANFYSSIFITSLDSSGNLKWTRDDYSIEPAYSSWVTTDIDNNIYIVGDFKDSIAFGNLNAISYSDYDGFLLKMNKYGQPDAIETISSNGLIYNCFIGVSNYYEKYIVGNFHDSLLYDTALLSGSGFYDLFIIKSDTNGNVLFIDKYGNGNGIRANGGVLDYNNDLILTGNFIDQCTFNDSSITTFGGSDAFVMQVSSNGDLQWVRNMGGTGTDVGISVTTDQSNNVFVLGFFTETGYFGDTSIVCDLPLSDLFYTKLSSSGEFLWTKSINTSFSAYDDHNRHSIECDNEGNLYITGWFWDTLVVEGVPYYSTGVYDSFIMKTDPGGNMLWIKQITGTESQYCKSIDIDNSGNIYVTGRFYGTAYFDSLELTSYGAADIFIGKLHEEPVSVWYNNVNKTLDVKVYPNPASNYLNIDVSDIVKRAEIYSANGRLINTYANNCNQIDVSGFPSGTYILKLFFYGSVYSEKIVIQ